MKASLHLSPDVVLQDKYTQGQDDHMLLPVFKDAVAGHLSGASKYESSLHRRGFTGAKGDVAHFDDGETTYTIVGLGTKEELTKATLHEALGNLIRKENNTKKGLFIDLRGIDLSEEQVAELVYTAYLANYTFLSHKTLQKEEYKKTVEILVNTISDSLKMHAENMRVLAEAVFMTRDLVNEPSNIVTPAYMAELLEQEGKKAGMKVEVFDEKKIQKLGMNLMYAVGKGSEYRPHFVKLSYRGSKNSGHIALVGKGVTFDTGGVQNKPEYFMNTMKMDMGGAATVLGIIFALANGKAEVNVDAYVPFVVNAVDGGAYNPDDIYTAFNGKTVEINHTDAEGRLILADALAYASSEKPEAIFNFATLTGAATVALGPEYISMMGDHEEAFNTLLPLGEEIDDKGWRLPLNERYKKYIHSDVADITNVPKNKRNPGTIVGGMFLKEFIGEGIKWIHNDIAAVAATDKAEGIYNVFATGRGVRLYTEFLRNSV